MISISLYGGLEEFFGETVSFDACNPSEIFRALAYQSSAFTDYISDSAKNGLAYKVIVDGEAIDESGLNLPVIATISIAPIVVGSGEVGRILLGAALVGVSFLVPGGILGISASSFLLAGQAFILGGVSSLLTGKPSEGSKNLSSYLLDPNGQPRTYQGDAIPIAFGDYCYIENPPIVTLWLDTENIPVDLEIT